VMLRKLAKSEANVRVARRLLAIANALDGMDRKAAAEAAGMDRQTLPDWVIRYNEHGVDGMLDRWGSGRPSRLGPDELAELYAIVLAGPDPEKDGICAFTREDLVRICERRFDKTMHRGTMGRQLRKIGLSRQKAHPSHPRKDPASQEALKKSPATPGRACAYT
jgi:transposase